MIPELFALGALVTSIPTIWWATNKTRAVCERWWKSRKPPQHEYNWNSWCMGCDEVRPVFSMDWIDIDNDGMTDHVYRCRTCRDDVWVKQHSVDDGVPDEYRKEYDDGTGNIIVVYGNQNVHDTFYSNLTAFRAQAKAASDGIADYPDAAAYCTAVKRYRAAGVDATNETNEAYERRLQERIARKYGGKPKENLMWRANA